MKSLTFKIQLVSLIFIGLFCQFSAKSQEALYPFADKGKYGYINKTGKVIIPAQFEFADKFYEGLAVVKQGGKRGFIDPAGKMVIPAQYDSKVDGYFSEGVACVKKGAKYTY